MRRLSASKYDIMHEQLKYKQTQVDRLSKKFRRPLPIKGHGQSVSLPQQGSGGFSHPTQRKNCVGRVSVGSHHIVSIDSCQIEDVLADKIIVAVRKLLPSFKLSAYNEDTGRWLLRHVLVKRGFATNQTMLVLVTGTPVFHPEITLLRQSANSSPK